MKPVAELLIVFYNTRQNAYEGSRNVFTKVEVADKGQIKTAILNAFNAQLAKVRGHVLVKFDGKMWLCERDTVNPQKVYTRHEINCHPLQNHFTI
jgi:hypothetical protein